MRLNLIIIVLGFSSLAQAQDLLQFAQKTKGLYSTEIADKTIFDHTYTARSKLVDPLYDWAFAYDPNSQRITIKMTDLHSELRNQLYVDRCRNTGQYIGQNAFGVRARVSKRTCQRVAMNSAEKVKIGAELHDAGSNRVLTFTGTPDEFRKLKAAKGFDIEVVVQPVIPDGEVTKYESVESGATLDSPVETTLQVYRVFVDFKAVRYYVPGAKTPFLVQDPANSDPRAP